MAAQKKRPSGLGRDFYSLLDDNLIESVEGATKIIRLSDIEPDPEQPRREFDAEALASLAASIKEFGLLQPIIVKENIDGSGTYKIIAGERRWRASRLAELVEIPCVVFTGDEFAAAQVSLIENIQRKDLTPVEESLAYRALIEKFGMTQEQLADKVGRSRPAITNALRLLELPEEVLLMVSEGRLSAGHARTLLGLNDKSMIAPMADTVIALDLSVRELEKRVKQANKPIKTAEKPMTLIDEQRLLHYTELERRTRDSLGRRVKITDKGKGKRCIEIDYEDFEDLEALLIRICGEDIFPE